MHVARRDVPAHIDVGVVPLDELALVAHHVDVAPVVLDQVLLRLEGGQVLGHHLLVDLQVLLHAREEGDAVLVQRPHVRLVEVAGVHDGEPGVYVVGLQLTQSLYERGDVYHVARAVAEEERQVGVLLHHIDEAHLVGDLAVVVADGRQGEVDAVGQPGAVDEDVVAPIAPGHQGKVLLEEGAVGPLVADGGQQVADALAAQVRPGVQLPDVAALPPGEGVAVGHVALHVVVHHRIERVGVAVAQRLDDGPQALEGDVLGDEEGIAEVEYEQLPAPLAPKHRRHVGGGRRAVAVRLQIVGEHAPLPVLVDAPLLIQHPAKVDLFCPDLLALPPG